MCVLTSESVQCFYIQNILKENNTGFVHGIAYAEICGILNCVGWEGKNMEGLPFMLNAQ